MKIKLDIHLNILGLDNFSMPLEGLIKYLQEVLSRVPEGHRASANVLGRYPFSDVDGGGDGCTELEIYYTRLETDEEEQTRERRRAVSAGAATLRQRKEYERLKALFEPSTDGS